MTGIQLHVRHLILIIREEQPLVIQPVTAIMRAAVKLMTDGRNDAVSIYYTTYGFVLVVYIL